MYSSSGVHSRMSPTFSPSQYSHSTPCKYGYDEQRSSSHMYSSPVLKGHSNSYNAHDHHSHQRRGAYNNTTYSDYYGSNCSTSRSYYRDGNSPQYNSGASTASSSQENHYGEDMDELDIYSTGSNSMMVDPEMMTVPTVPTPMTLSKFEHGKTPSGRVLITVGNQTVEFFSCVVNAPAPIYSVE